MKTITFTAMTSAAYRVMITPTGSTSVANADKGLCFALGAKTTTSVPITVINCKDGSTTAYASTFEWMIIADNP